MIFFLFIINPFPYAHLHKYVEEIKLRMFLFSKIKMNARQIAVITVLVLILVVVYILLTRHYWSRPKRLAVASTVFALLWITTVIVTYNLWLPASAAQTNYSCTNGNCVSDSNGPYTSLSSCQANCQAPSGTKYSCTNGVCVSDSNGQYTSLSLCKAACQAPAGTNYSCTKGVCGKDPNGQYTSLSSCQANCQAPAGTNYSCTNGVCGKDPNGQYTSLSSCQANCPTVSSFTISVDYLTIEYNPTSYYPATDTISPWFNESIKMMEKGDVAVFMTDYMIIHPEILANMTTAIQKGAKFILGSDRWYVCGYPYQCDGDNKCPNTNCTNVKPRVPNCYCNIPQAAGCTSFNAILDQLDYCNNKDNIIVVDQPSNKVNDDIWGHAHRKIINFYYQSSTTSRMICGSWNIDADLGRTNLGVKETSIGVETKLTDGFAQYMLQMDIDTLTPIMTYVPSVATASPNVISLLKSLKNHDLPGYPKLPLMCTVNWTDKTPYYTSSSGTDDNVEIWLGISPPPVNPANKFTSPDNVVYNPSAPLPDGDNKWQQQYTLMQQKSQICQKSGTGDKGGGTWAPYCTDKNGKMIPLNFAEGGTWAGLLFQKFFDQSMKSPFINISMYVGFDIQTHVIT